MMPPRDKAAPPLAPATLSEHKGVRYLHLGTPWVQGAMRVAKPHAIELEYVQRMMAWMLWRPSDKLTQGHAVQLGLGAASITRFCHDRLCLRTTAVEVNAAVIGVCRIWFKLPADGERLTVLNLDAAHWVRNKNNESSAQVLSIDLYDHDAAAPVLDDEAFYRACYNVLADGANGEGGLMSVNLFGRDASFEASLQRITRVFSAHQVWSLQPTKEGNTVVVASRGVSLPDSATLVERAEYIEAQFGLKARKWVHMIQAPPTTVVSA